MTEETKTVAAQAPKVIATLVHGMYYDYAGQVWNNHTANNQRPGTYASREVDAETEAYLRENAIHVVQVDGVDYSKCRFKFSNDDDPKPTTRKRVRGE